MSMQRLFVMFKTKKIFNLTSKELVVSSYIFYLLTNNNFNQLVTIERVSLTRQNRYLLAN